MDRLSRSLLDFARIMERFDRHGVSFVSVTQQFNTTSSMRRLFAVDQQGARTCVPVAILVKVAKQFEAPVLESH